MADKLTDPQIRTLKAAVARGGAAYARVRRMGGAHRRMIDRLVAAGLLDDTPPFPATDAGRAALAAACPSAP